MVCRQEFSYDIDMNASAYAQCKDVYIPDFDVEVEAKGKITGCRLVPIKQDGCAKSCRYRLKVDYQIDPYVKICGPKRGHANFDVVVDAKSKVGCARQKDSRPCEDDWKPKCKPERRPRRECKPERRHRREPENKPRACNRHARHGCKKCAY